ncbi:MAG: C40 family peptidase [Nakamurella sp.]
MVAHARTRLRRAGLVFTAVLALTLTVTPAPPVTAEPLAADGHIAVPQPAPPTDVAQAQAAWMAAEERAGQLNQAVLQAQVDLDAAVAAVATADADVTAAAAAVVASSTTRDAAQAAVDGYQGQLKAFAGATFRGARTSALTALLTADSPDSYLDSVVALDRVAAANNDLLEEARTARTAAEAAIADVQVKQEKALATQQSARSVRLAAQNSQADLAATQADFAGRVTEYESLYNQLSERDRLAALAAEEDRLAAEAAAAAAANPADPIAAAVAGITAPAGTPAATVSVPLADAPNRAAQTAVEAALSKVGSRYVWGAAGPEQFDCSGLTSWAWNQAGVTIPRTSGTQAGLPVVPLDQLRPGDLITFYSPVSHVAMYIGDGQMVQASTASKPVYVTTIAKGGPNPVGHRVG